MSRQRQLLIVTNQTELKAWGKMLGYSRLYVLSETTKKLLKRRGLNLVCNRCGKPLEAGQSVMSKKGHSRRSSRHYHQGCYASLYV